MDTLLIALILFLTVTQFVTATIYLLVIAQVFNIQVSMPTLFKKKEEEVQEDTKVPLHAFKPDFTKPINVKVVDSPDDINLM